MATIRRQIIELLFKDSLSARDISRVLGISEREVFTHLPHIQRTVSTSGRRFQILPAECLSCGYVFNKRSRLTRPSRCFRCKSEHVSEPSYCIG